MASKLPSKQFKLVMFDIDGVLNEHGGNIQDASKQAIDKLRKHNIRVGFASGKHAWYIQGGLVWSGLLTADTLIVAENGGVIYDPASRKTVHEDKYLRDVKLLRSIFYNLYKKKSGFLNFAGLTVWEEPKETLFCLYPQDVTKISNLAKVIQEIIEVNNLHLYIVENPDSVDVLQQNINKATGLQHICSWLGLEMQNIISVGDSDNDKEMLAASGLAITLANGKSGIKDLVKSRGKYGFIATRKYGDGVLQAVNYLLDSGFC